MSRRSSAGSYRQGYSYGREEPHARPPRSTVRHRATAGSRPEPPLARGSSFPSTSSAASARRRASMQREPSVREPTSRSFFPSSSWLLGYGKRSERRLPTSTALSSSSGTATMGSTRVESSSRRSVLGSITPRLRSQSSSSYSPAASPRTSPRKPPARGKLCCDRCDGNHETDACPHFRKPREKHPDATRRKPLVMGGSGGNFVLRRAQVVPQPGDGSCLFHSMCYGLGMSSASSLRRSIGAFIASNPQLEIAETPLRDWVKWDSGTSVSTYASRISRSGWGGGIEMAACSRMHKVNVHVYERGRTGGGFKRISCFDAPGARKTIHVLYRGGVHYDALVPR
eukprot:CAMPEP_0118995548 /NCGR_PEP_ID=MMETSP1173-20130426/58647_1 /TAXON_ID=1034831 /ORGANISM="Rhizochromulina marina cf, Strain CCMP1243" /LENGTH=340 /DNA_ID=CAMNT_0006946889 /DNA_START=130 /DNA_END=1152 /DNA_ORIENTATION=-